MEVKIEQELADLLEKEAKIRGVSVGDLVSELVNKHLKHLEGEEQV